MILVTADLHLSVRRRDEYRWDGLRQIAHHLSDCSALVVLGDLCTEKDRHNAQLVNRVVGWFFDLEVPCYILKGNHDYIDPDCPFWGILNNLDNVRFLTRQERVDIDGLDCMFIPHTNDFAAAVRQYDEDWGVDSPAALADTPPDCLFLHQTFMGSQTPTGFELVGTNHSLIPKAQFVLSGDVHMPQKVGPVQYVGAPYPTAFGETFQGSVLKVSVDRTKRCTLTHPAKITAEIRTVDDLDKIKTSKGDHVRVKVMMRRSEFSDWPKMRAAVLAWAEERGIELYSVVMVPHSQTQRVRIQPTKQASGPRALFDQFCKVKACGHDSMAVGRSFVE